MRSSAINKIALRPINHHDDDDDEDDDDDDDVARLKR
jgi:hypothetical protein